jgi:hypothetical protein
MRSHDGGKAALAPTASRTTAASTRDMVLRGAMVFGGKWSGAGWGLWGSGACVPLGIDRVVAG